MHSLSEQSAAFAIVYLAEQRACFLLRVERQKQIIESFRQGGMGEDAFL